MAGYLDLRREMEANPQGARDELSIARARAIESSHQRRMDEALSQTR